jgi:uncharacterized protein
VSDDTSHQQVPRPDASGDDRPADAPDVPWGFLDAAGIFVVAFLLMGLVSPLLGAALDPAVARAAFFPLSLALLAVVTVLWVRIRFPDELGRLFGRRPGLSDLGMGLVHGAAGFFVINVGFSLILQAFAAVTGAELPEVQQDGRFGFVVIASAVIVAPIAEELYFRGLLFQGLSTPLGVWPGIGLSALIFGIAHYEQGNLEGSLYALIVLSTLGGYLAWVLHRRGTIATPMVMHAVFNALAVGGILIAG